MKELINLTESELRAKIQETVHQIITEYDMDEPDEDFSVYSEAENASEDFYNSGCEGTLKEKYPNMEFEFDVENDGTVTALDVNTGKYYIGNGEIEYDTVGLGHPSSNDYNSEAEGQVAYYDFYNCLKTIMQKIDNDKPDGIDNNYIETN